MSNLCYVVKLLPILSACFIYTPFVILSVYVALWIFFHLLTLSYLLTCYVIYAPNNCTCTSHQTAQLSLSSLQSCHFNLGGSRHGWGFLLGQPDPYSSSAFSALCCSLLAQRQGGFPYCYLETLDNRRADIRVSRGWKRNNAKASRLLVEIHAFYAQEYRDKYLLNFCKV